MNSLSFRPTVEVMEGRDAPVILMTVLPLTTLFNIPQLSFEFAANPREAREVQISTRVALVTIKFVPDPPR